jgi:hypothetical protein
MSQPTYTNGKKEFTEWWKAAKPGESVVYFTGNLADFCWDVIGRSEARANARELRGHVYATYERGEVFLFQRRISTNVFDYIAVKAKGPPYKSNVTRFIPVKGINRVGAVREWSYKRDEIKRLAIERTQASHAQSHLSVPDQHQPDEFCVPATHREPPQVRAQYSESTSRYASPPRQEDEFLALLAAEASR